MRTLISAAAISSLLLVTGSCLANTNYHAYVGAHMGWVSSQDTAEVQLADASSLAQSRRNIGYGIDLGLLRDISPRFSVGGGTRLEFLRL